MATAMTKNPYLADSVATASPGRLLVMLYDRLALDLTRAESAIEQQDHNGAHAALMHAQDIVIELRATLDVSVWAAGQQLALVYDYLLELLIDANVRKDAGTVRNCTVLLEPIHDAWREIAGLGSANAA